MTNYYIGLDLGQVSDYTAVCVVEAYPPLQYGVRHLERYRLGTPYPTIVEKATTLVQLLTRGDSTPRLVVDATGVGRPVVDLLTQAGLNPIAITITGGDTPSRNGREWRVPKRDLVGALVVAFQGQRLKIAEALPEARTLIDELLNFKVKISASGHDSYEAWREGVHDDLVLSVAMAVWAARQFGTGDGPAITEAFDDDNALPFAGPPLDELLCDASDNDNRPARTRQIREAELRPGA